MATAAPEHRICRFSTTRSSRSTSRQHGKMKIRAGSTSAPQIAQDPRDSGHGRRVRAAPAPLPDRLLGRRQSGSARADGPQRGRQRVPRRGRAAARPDASTCRPICAAIRSCWRGCARTATSCRCASTRRRARSANSTKASRCSTATSRARRPRRSSQFCEQFEAAGQRTAAFMEELKKSDLLMDGEVAIQPEGAEQPFVYRGFRWSTRRSCASFAATSCAR